MQRAAVWHLPVRLGDVTAACRHLSYDFKSDANIEDIRFSGFAVGVGFMF